MDMITYLRSFRIFGFAILDFTATFVAAVLVGPVLSWLCRKIGLAVPLLTWVLWSVPISILAHVAFKTYTPLTLSFIDPHGHLLVKVVMAVLVVGGAILIRRV